MLTPEQMNDLIEYTYRDPLWYVRLDMELTILNFRLAVQRGIKIGRPFPAFHLIPRFEHYRDNPEEYIRDFPNGTPKLHFKREDLGRLQEDFKEQVIQYEVGSDRIFNTFFNGRGDSNA